MGTISVIFSPKKVGNSRLNRLLYDRRSSFQSLTSLPEADNASATKLPSGFANYRDNQINWLGRLHGVQHLLRMIGRLGHLAPVFFDLSIRSDPNRGPDHAHNGLAVHFLLTERLIPGHHFFFRVAQQCERKIVFFDELLVRGLAVRRNAQNDDVSFLEFTHQVTESLGLLGSPGCVVLGVKVKDDVFSPEVFQSYLVAVLIRQCERRCGFAFLNCHDHSFPFL